MPELWRWNPHKIVARGESPVPLAFDRLTRAVAGWASRARRPDLRHELSLRLERA